MFGGCQTSFKNITWKSPNDHHAFFLKWTKKCLVVARHFLALGNEERLTTAMCFSALGNEKHLAIARCFLASRNEEHLVTTNHSFAI